MADLNFSSKLKAPWKLNIKQWVVSLVSVLFTQFALFLVPHFFTFSSLLTLLSLSVGVVLVVAGLGRACKRLLGVRASAPAFVVFNILYVWCVYLLVIRPEVSCLLDIVFNSELVILMIGLCRMLYSDPGYFAYGSSSPENLVTGLSLDVETHLQELESISCEMHEGHPDEEESTLQRRVRYCKICKVYVKGFDHHCPAFGNCIGQKNHFLFIILLAGFIMSEVSYIACFSQFSVAEESHNMNNNKRKTNLSNSLANSTMLFSLLQVLWQVVFLFWHLYSVCFNITTDEWINWKRYPELQLVVPLQLGQPERTYFINPYDKGIIQNVKDFLQGKE